VQKQILTVLKQGTTETENVLSCLFISCSVSFKRRFETVGGLEMEGQRVIKNVLDTNRIYIETMLGVQKHGVFWYFC